VDVLPASLGPSSTIGMESAARPGDPKWPCEASVAYRALHDAADFKVLADVTSGVTGQGIRRF